MVNVEVTSPRPDWSFWLDNDIGMLFLNHEMEGRGEPAAEQERLVGLEEDTVAMAGGNLVIDTLLDGRLFLTKPR